MAAGDVKKELDLFVSEYLESRGLKQTLSVFHSESKENRSSGPGNVSDLQSEFVVAFECGEREVFFQLWEEHVPPRLRNGDPTAQHLEFSVSVYFAVYPMRTGTGDKEASMTAFRSYLESRGSELSQNQELATFFALPYVPNPSQHPSFKNLLLDSWTMELKARLIQFLELTFPNTTDTPKLVKLYLRDQRKGGAIVQEDCVSKLAELQSSYHTLVGISMELVSALESAIAGRPITPEFIQSICTRLFQSSTSQSQLPPEPPKTPSNTSLLRASVISLRQSMQVSEGRSLSESELDYERIKAELVGRASGIDKALLIQALRWRLTRSLPGGQRDSVLSQYVGEDLLGCSASDSIHQIAILKLLQSSDPHLREQLSRLFNTFASLTGGRAYISQAPPIIQGILYLMYGEKGEDSHTRRNCLGAIQKLSLRRSIVRMMIRNSVVKFLAESLLVQPHSDYTIRYSLALLLNICLRCIGKTYCKPYGESLLTVLGEYLEHEDQEICNYVNGALYSLLACPSFREVAKRMGMEEMLQSALRASPPDLQSQIQYIISQLNSDGSEPEDSGDEGGTEEEEDEEEDPDIIEGDEEEMAITNKGLTGEDLLKERYSINAQPASHSGSAKSAREELNSTYSKSSFTNQQLIDTHSTGTTLIRTEEQLTLNSQAVEAPHTRPVTPQSFRPHTSTSVHQSHDFISSSSGKRPTSS